MKPADTGPPVDWLFIRQLIVHLTALYAAFTAPSGVPRPLVVTLKSSTKLGRCAHSWPPWKVWVELQRSSCFSQEVNIFLVYSKGVEPVQNYVLLCLTAR